MRLLEVSLASWLLLKKINLSREVGTIWITNGGGRGKTIVSYPKVIIRIHRDIGAW
jgi:hypothetical protein